MQTSTLVPIDKSIHYHDTLDAGSAVAGNPLDISCLSNTRMLITSIRYDFTTAAAGSYLLIYVVPSAGDPFMVSLANTAQNAFTTTEIFHQLNRYDTYYRSASNKMWIPLYDNLYLVPGDTLRITSVDMAANRNIEDCFLNYEAWIIA